MIDTFCPAIFRVRIEDDNACIAMNLLFQIIFESIITMFLKYLKLIVT